MLQKQITANVPDEGNTNILYIAMALIISVLGDEGYTPYGNYALEMGKPGIKLHCQVARSL